MERRLDAALQALTERGWVVCGEDRYALTGVGRVEAERLLADMRRARARLQRLARPETVSQISVAAHPGLAALKLPAGLLSGSVVLLNDAADTLIDGLSSILVCAGIRCNRERAVNVVLVLFMLGTGAWTLFQAARRLVVPVQPEVDPFAFSAALTSALVCLCLWLYQRWVGLRSGAVSLITQSVDSRNHVIVAASVTAGLISALLHFTLLDTLVGLAVALLILKSAVELGVEVVRSLNEDDPDLSRYELGLAERYERFCAAQLCDWMLYVIDRRQVATRAALHAQASQALYANDNPVLCELDAPAGDRRGAGRVVHHRAGPARLGGGPTAPVPH